MSTDPRNQPKMPVYKLAEGYRIDSNGKPVYGWPYLISYVPECSTGVFFMEDGDDRHGNGGFFHASQILQPIWHSHFEAADALWLLPILERMASGEAIGSQEIFEAYKTVHGEYPPPGEMERY